MKGKIRKPEEVVKWIRNGSTVAISGAGPVGIPDAILAKIEERFIETDEPRDLTVIHASGVGDGKSKGLNHLAHEGMVKRIIGSHWGGDSPKMAQLIEQNKLEAYSLPYGVICHLIRNSAAGRPGSNYLRWDGYLC